MAYGAYSSNTSVPRVVNIQSDINTGVAEWYSFPPVPVYASMTDGIITDWGQLTVDTSPTKKKRVTIFGKRPTGGEEEAQHLARAFFKILKEGLTKQQKKKFEQLAEKAFKEAVKATELGMKEVSRKFEEEMTRNLNLAALDVSGYDKYITDIQIEKYRDNLPSSKELIIDEIDEYEKPIPGKVQSSLRKAKDAKCFEAFYIFWIRTVKDPILFGRVNGLKERYYFIDQWAKDLKIQDFLKY